MRETVCVNIRQVGACLLSVCNNIGMAVMIDRLRKNNKTSKLRKLVSFVGGLFVTLCLVFILLGGCRKWFMQGRLCFQTNFMSFTKFFFNTHSFFVQK